VTDSFDILGLGAVAIDELLYIDEYPAADAKVRVQRRERQCGGLTATALVAAARLGASCVYAGTLGEGELSQFALDTMSREGIDVSPTVRKPGLQPIHSVVLVDQSGGTRTLFYDINNVEGAQDEWPAEETVRNARVVLVDGYGTPAMIRAARIAREAGHSVVADFENADPPRFDELLQLVDHLILSRQFACSLTGATDPADAAKQLWADGRELAAVTCGIDGSHFVTSSGQVKSVPAFQVETVDTTGCGDTFHGAYATALARGMNADDRMRFASGAAAIKATMNGGQAGCPSLEAVERFLSERTA